MPPAGFGLRRIRNVGHDGNDINLGEPARTLTSNGATRNLRLARRLSLSCFNLWVTVGSDPARGLHWRSCELCLALTSPLPLDRCPCLLSLLDDERLV